MTLLLVFTFLMTNFVMICPYHSTQMKSFSLSDFLLLVRQVPFNMNTLRHYLCWRNISPPERRELPPAQFAKQLPAFLNNLDERHRNANYFGYPWLEQMLHHECKIELAHSSRFPGGKYLLSDNFQKGYHSLYFS